MLNYSPTLQPLPNVGSYNSTPPGYATPAQIASMREYAKTLMTGTGQQPVHHWTQGVSNMVSALMGGNMDYNAQQRELGSQQFKQQQVADTLNGTGAFANGGAPPVPFSEAQPSEGNKETEGSSDIDRAANATSSQESGGNYLSIGRQTRNGDRAYGKYQVMGENIPQWTAEALGRPMNIADFLHNPEAQDAVYKHKFGEYMQKYGPEGAAKAWFAGEAGMKNPNATDVNGMTVDRYGRNFASAFAGSGGGSSSPAVQATAAALRGGNPAPDGATDVAAAGKAAPGPYRQQLAQASGQPPVIDPALVPRPQTNITHEQLKQMTGDQWLAPGTGADMYNRAIQQGQPVKVPVTGGNVIVDPRTGRQQFFPDVHWGEKSLPGGLKYPLPQMVVPGPNGANIQNITPATAGPRSDAGTGTMPSSGPGTPSGSPSAPAAPEAGPVQASGSGAPAAPTTAPASAPTAPVQVASTDPNAGFSTAAKNTPPAGEQVAEVKQPDVQPMVRAFGAGSKPPPGYSKEDWEATTGYKDYESKTAIDQANKIENNKANNKRYEDLMTKVDSAYDQANNLHTAKQLMTQQGFYSGLGSGLVENWQKLKAALGYDPNAAFPMETFKKTMANSIMSGLRTAFQGFGQIRVAEIRLQEMANASLQNTPASNAALIEISRRNAERVAQIGDIASQYRTGGEVVDPISGKTLVKENVGPDGQVQERNGLDAGYDKVVHQFAKENPTFTKEEYASFEKTLTGEGKADQEGAKTELPPAPPAAVERMRANPNDPAFRESFEKRWGPVEKYLGGKK